jgi:hypothetical protein
MILDGPGWGSEKRQYTLPDPPHARPAGPLRSAKSTDPTRTLSHGPAARLTKRSAGGGVRGPCAIWGGSLLLVDCDLSNVHTKLGT